MNRYIPLLHSSSIHLLRVIFSSGMYVTCSSYRMDSGIPRNSTGRDSIAVAIRVVERSGDVCCMAYMQLYPVCMGLILWGLYLGWFSDRRHNGVSLGLQRVAIMSS